jgi:uncharacterized protein (TIGR01777 family)
MRVLVAGASGLIGTELVRRLALAGHTVTKLTRSEARAPDEHTWEPAAGLLDPQLVEESDAVIDLAGASISRIPWTLGWKHEILDSRLAATRTLTHAIATASSPPAVLLNASAVGFYGDRPGEVLTEESPRGSGYLSDVVVEWEAAAAEAADATRVVTLRTGLVVGRGGAFAPLEALTRAGLAATLGNGRQYWPWIALEDEAAAIVHLLHADVAGPVNLEGPVPATSGHVTRTLAAALHRWHPWRIPGPAIGITLGQAGRELLLADQRAVPSRLLESGFRFRFETVDDVIASVWS